MRTSLAVALRQLQGEDYDRVMPISPGLFRFVDAKLRMPPNKYPVSACELFRLPPPSCWGYAGSLAKHSRELTYICKADRGGNLANIPLGSC